jgi:putative RecB family exonuclease
MDRQLTLYQVGVQNRWRDVQRIKLVWHYLAFDAEFSSTRTEFDIQKTKAEVAALIGRIESASEFSPKRSALCDWCEYRAYCPLGKHPARVERLPPNEYLMDDGVRLVNKYVELSAQKSALEQELEKVREAIFAYCKRENAQILVGSEFKLNVRFYKNYKFPSRTDYRYRFLEELVRGSHIWERVATVNVYELGRLLREETLEEPLRSRLLEYANLVEVGKIYPARRREHD